MTTISEGHHSARFVCPQCGGPTDGSAVSNGRRSSFCEDCVGDRDIIADAPYPLAE